MRFGVEQLARRQYASHGPYREPEHCISTLMQHAPLASRSCLMDQTIGKSTRQQHTMSTTCRMSRQLRQGRCADAPE